MFTGHKAIIVLSVFSALVTAAPASQTGNVCRSASIDKPMIGQYPPKPAKTINQWKSFIEADSQTEAGSVYMTVKPNVMSPITLSAKTIKAQQKTIMIAEGNNQSQKHAYIYQSETKTTSRGPITKYYYSAPAEDHCYIPFDQPDGPTFISMIEIDHA